MVWNRVPIEPCLHQVSLIQTQKCPKFVSSEPNLPYCGSLDGNELCGVDRSGRGTYTSEGIDKICAALQVNSTLQSLRYDLNPNLAQILSVAADKIELNLP